MKCSMLWNGGSSYAHVSEEDDLEAFDSLKQMKWAFERRAMNSETQYPCVESCPPDEGGPEAWVFLSDKPESLEYPDRIMRFGPRGGVRLESA